MEIILNIPQNTYKQPTEARPEVVQAICDSFFCRGWGVFHPFHGANNGCRNATLWIDLKDPGFGQPASRKKLTRIFGCEVAAAFSALRKAGYHMYKIYEYGSWMGYVCDPKPFREGGVEVTHFSDFID